MDESYGSCECRRRIKRFCVEISGQIGTVFVKKNTAFLGKGLQKKRKGVTRFAAGVPSTLARCRVARTADRRHFVLAAKTMALNLAECRRRRVKIGLHLAGSHYNNYGRVAGKLHATVPLTVSPG